ncbi:transposase family protein [Pasteurella testudinis]|uniref:transposase family protein n=1 Tax=Pasteurella testudinis TaxID=761 RepID=UPI004057EDD0
MKRFGEYHLNWLRQYLLFKRGIPVDDTIARVIRRLSPSLMIFLLILSMKYAKATWQPHTSFIY